MIDSDFPGATAAFTADPFRPPPSDTSHTPMPSSADAPDVMEMSGDDIATVVVVSEEGEMVTDCRISLPLVAVKREDVNVVVVVVESWNAIDDTRS